MKEATSTLSLERYEPSARALVAGAQTLADEHRHAEVLPLHLLVRALDRDAGVKEVFRRAVGNVAEFEGAAQRALGSVPRSQSSAFLSNAMLDLLERAERESTRERSEKVQVEHILNALSQEIRGLAGEVLGAFGLAPGALRPHLPALRATLRPTADNTPLPATNYLRSLVDEARTGPSDPVLLRVMEVRRLLAILERRDKHHPILVGEPGVGKAAIIRGLAQRLATHDVPTNLIGVHLCELDPSALVAGARLRSETEERARRLLNDLSSQSRPSVLVVRRIEHLFAQNLGNPSLGEWLRPALLRGEIKLLGTTTPEGWKRIHEKDAQLARLLTILPIAEPSLEEATVIVRGIAARYEAHHAVQISETAVTTAVELAKRYVHDRFLPDSALDLLDEAAARKRVELDGISEQKDRLLHNYEDLNTQLTALAGGEDRETIQARTRLEQHRAELKPEAELAKQGLEERRKRVTEARGTLTTNEPMASNSEGLRWLTAEDVAQTLAIWTGVPVAKMMEAETEKLLKMEERLTQRVVGQDDAVRALARAVRRGRVGLRDPKRPIGSFLFLGPSGVGKTELAKALAQFLFDDEQALTRLDMSEFMERHMAQRLIGAPPGYADSEHGGFLTEAVRQRPYSVLLFDEVEKAHGDVFNLLLQVLDDGRLTDGRGRLADFSNTVVIMTSNIGSERILDTEPKLFESDEGRAALRDVLLDGLKQFFRPEFLNRVDEVLVFRPLTRDHLLRVVEIQLKSLEQLLAPRHLKLEVSSAAKQRLVEMGYEPALGGRPVKRVILRCIQDPLAEALLAGSFPEGSTVKVEAKEDGSEFAIKAGAPPAQPK